MDRLFAFIDHHKYWLVTYSVATEKGLSASPTNPFYHGGGTQESNLPKEFLTPLNGFEDRASHQRSTCLHTGGIQLMHERARYKI